MGRAVVTERASLGAWRSCPRLDLPGEVHVWWFRLDDPLCARWMDQYRSILSEEERRRAESFRFREGQLAHACGWVLVRLALSSYVDVPPEAWTFARESGGRPEVVGPSGACGLRFNLSHTAGLVACAVTWGRPVGVDVEDASRPAPLEIADRFFSPEEAASLHELPTSLRSRHFFRLWTLKEAYTKARGLGLTLPLDQFTVAIGAGSAARLRFEGEENDGSGWQLFAFEPTPLHHGAVAVRSEGGSLDLRVIAVEQA